MRKPSGAVFISSIYFIFGFLWILFSDKILLNIIIDQSIYARIQTWKGWIYVLLTTILIYLLLRAYITKKKNAIINLENKEIELLKTVEEKEILINELHHRVKNNLQMLTSLIRLKKNSLENIGETPLIEKIEEQLHTISLIHEKIFINNQAAFIKMKIFIEDLSKSIQFKNSFKKIELIQEIEDSLLPIDIALPFGIIISEVLSNAFKHAFGDDDRGIVHIQFSAAHGNYYLSIRDNGCGYDPETMKSSFGLDLIKILTEQLEAEISIQSSPGKTEVTIIKPIA